MARLARIEYSNQSQLDLELHERVMADKAEERYRKHYDFCAEVLGGILDFSTRVIEYRELTNRLVPQKLYRDWSLLFVEGKPLFEVTQLPHKDPEEPTPEQILEEERQRLLDEGDFTEYRVRFGTISWRSVESVFLLYRPLAANDRGVAAAGGGGAHHSWTSSRQPHRGPHRAPSLRHRSPAHGTVAASRFN